MENNTDFKRNNNPILSLIDLTKRFKDKVVLNEISLDIYPRSVNAIIGQNGAGKTTLLRTILGLYNATSGTIKKSLQDSNFSMMLEHDYLCVKKTGYQNIEHFCKYFEIEISSVLKNIEKYANLLSIDNDLNLKVNSYSKGMKRKLSLLIVLLRNTEVIILDEPTSGVDPISRVEIRKLLLSLKNEGKTVLITSHDLVEVQKISDYISLINKGQIIKTFKGDIPHNDLEKIYFETLKQEDYYEANVENKY